MYHTLEACFQTAVRYGILLLETVGAAIILVYAVRALINLLSRRDSGRNLVTHGITTALNFLLASEVLKTLVAPDWKDIGMTCAILLMRAGMSVLIHWESKHE